jgi:NAD(P)-dependent dehydrogenase (short-subunit alcohol dehydrogenase family)
MAAPLISFSLANRVALVTGGAGYLGRAICCGLAEAGARVLVNGRNRDRVDRFVAELRGKGCTAEPLPFDVIDHAAAEQIVGTLDRLDILVNNAALMQTGTIATTQPRAFASAAAVAAEAAYTLTLAARPLMRRHGGGSVINVASMYGTVSPDPRIYDTSGFDNPPQYGVAKAGLIQLTRYLACHLAPEGIRVNAVSPGPFPPLERLAREHPKFLKALEDKVPMQRVGKPEEIAGVIVFLASDASSYITGTNIPVDGGWTAW